MSLFFPKMYGIQTEHNVHFATKNPGDFNDPFDETYLASTRTKQEEVNAILRKNLEISCF